MPFTPEQAAAHNLKWDANGKRRKPLAEGDRDALALGFRKASPTAEREADLHNEIADYIRSRGWLGFHGSMVRKSHRTIGEPDWTIFADNGRVFVVECKSRNGKLKPAQLGVKILLETLGHGHRYAVVRCMNDFLSLVNK